jgi:hypothetical protein
MKIGSYQRSNTMTLAGNVKMSVGDRFNGAAYPEHVAPDVAGKVAGKVAGILTYSDNSPAAVSLDIEPSTMLAQLAEWITQNVPFANLPRVAMGRGGLRTISGYDILVASDRGNLSLATGTEEERTSLAKMPDWWATRHEDLARQRAEDVGYEDALRTMFRVLRKLTAMFALAEPIPEERDTVRASGDTVCCACGFEYWRHATDPREPDMTITCSGRVHL